MTPISKNRKLAVAGVTAVTLLAGGATMAAAAGGGPSTGPAGSQVEAPGTETDDGDGPDEQDPSYVGSVQAPEEADGADESATGADDEAAEAAALAGLATVDQTSAAAAATAAVPGTVGAVSLENENGSVVWSVEVTQADGTVVDVKVDAGNASILAQQAGGADEESETGGASDTA